MKLIQITALLAPFIVMVLATPPVLPRSALEAVPRGCITSLVCDGGARQTAKCLLKGYGCPDKNPTPDPNLRDAEPVDGLVDGAALLVLGGAVDDVLDGGADERLIGGGTMVTLPDGADEGLIGGGTMVTLPEGAGVELPGGDTEALTMWDVDTEPEADPDAAVPSA
ncbi:hypothetical protein B0H14DRAFT_3774371 [Mycena olivaceomarginata]|nr:hypothetical protein B0H14DRAFT_3774371 [Mycena olivaceomarginata]